MEEPERPKEEAPPRGHRWRRHAPWAAVALLAIALVAWWLTRAATDPSREVPVQAGDHASQDAAAPRAQVRLRGERQLVGTVVDDQEVPLAGASLRVSSLDDANALPWETTTDAEGRFNLAALVPHALSIEVTREGHDGAERTLRADDNAELSFVLSRQGELLVVLRDLPGRDVAGTVVTLTGPGLWPAMEIVSNAAGEALFTKLAFGEYRARARRGARVAPPSDKARVVPGERTQLDMTLKEGATLRVGVRDSTTKAAIAAAQIAIFDATPGIPPVLAESDEKGAATIEGLLPTTLRVEISHAGHAPRSVDVKLPTASELLVQLDGEASVSGLVVDERGQLVSDALISVSTRDGLPVRVAGAEKQAVGELGVTRGPVPRIPISVSAEPALGTLASRSDAKGAFRVHGLSPSPLVLSAARAGYAMQSVEIDDLAPHTERRDVRLVLREAGRIEGSIRDLRGHAVVGAYISARVEGGTELSAISDTNGSFALLDIVGEVTVVAEASGYAQPSCQVTVTARATERCDMTVGATLYELPVRVFDEYRFGLEGVVLSVTAAGSERVFTQVTRRDGTATVRDLPGPPYQVQAVLSGFVPGTAEATRAEREVRVVLQRAAGLAGTVTDALGRPVQGAVVSTDEGDAVGESDKSGGFLLTGVTPGALTLVAAHTSLGEARSREVRARAGETLEGLRIVLPGRSNAETNTSTAPSGETSTGTRLGDFGLEQKGDNIMFVDVQRGGAAERAGIRAGDVLVTVDGEPVLSPAQARGMLRDPAGLLANLRLTRQGSQLRVRYKRPAL